MLVKSLVVGGVAAAALYGLVRWIIRNDAQMEERRRLRELANAAYLRYEMDKVPDQKGDLWYPGE